MDHSIYSCGHTGLEMPKCGWRHMLMLRRMTYIALASRWSVRPMMITMPLGARAFRPPSSSTAAAGPVPPRQRRRHRRDIIGPTTLDHRGGISVRCSSPSSTAPDRRRDGGSLRVAGGSDGDAGEDDVLAATATTATTTATAARGGGGGRIDIIDRSREGKTENVHRPREGRRSGAIPELVQSRRVGRIELRGQKRIAERRQEIVLRLGNREQLR